MRCGGVSGKANVGISNDKESEKLSRRYSKVSGIYVNRSRVSRDLRRTRKGKSMDESVNILILAYIEMG